MNKVEGKVSDFCPKCKNCKAVTRTHNANDVVRIMEVDCKDPHDGMIKTLDADSDICCSMFELKEDKLMQYYREKSKNYEQILTDISRFVPVDVIDFKDLPKIIEQMRKTGDMYDTISESYDTLFDQKYEFQKANEKLEDKYHKLERKLTEEKKRFNQLYNEFLTPLARVLYPGEKVNKSYSEILKDVKDLKVYEDENKSMYEDLKYWRERCHSAETDVTTLNSKVEVLEKKLQKADSIRDAVGNESKLNQTISDQEVTIKALLITIKEMCKEDETNE